MGWDANVILEEVMNTSSVNQDIKRMIDEMYKCIEDKKYDEAEKIVDILDKKTNGYADGISKARILISRGKDVKQINKRSQLILSISFRRIPLEIWT